MSRDVEEGEAGFLGNLGFQLTFLPTKACGQKHLEGEIK